MMSRVYKAEDRMANSLAQGSYHTITQLSNLFSKEVEGAEEHFE